MIQKEVKQQLIDEYKTHEGDTANPWDRIQPQDAMSRHRGAKPPRRCGLLGEISLLSPG